MSQLYNAWLSGIGAYAPEKVLTNHDLEKMVDTNDEWIVTRTGIKERHIAAPGQSTSDIGAEAARRALAMAGLVPDDIDLIITATISPDMIFPATAALIQDKLQANNAGTVDIEAACTGYIYGLSMASQYIQTGKYRNVLVIGAETMSRLVDWTDRNTCVLFGDGAGAGIVSRAPEGSKSRLIDFYLRGAGRYGNLLYVPAGGSAQPTTEETVKQKMHYIKMEGQETFKLAVNSMATSIKSVLTDNGMTPNDIDWLIPHQANLRIMKMVAKLADIPEEKVVINIHKYGNTSAGTIPLAMAEYFEKGLLKRGQTVVSVAFGGGMTWGSHLMVF
jgi:3-oxoacyl-[acyl-carrier-protein] synthase-3